jgi:hypothetical protein
MESGLWYVFVYNDNDIPQRISFMGDVYGSPSSSKCDCFATKVSLLFCRSSGHVLSERLFRARGMSG